ncbi:MAG TPA: phosphatidate cytidylyltransferase, partial [Opitutaceae bacterium]|nr:phosphatidate cytidylyltransferase [Opitutaceae bacterium]
MAKRALSSLVLWVVVLATLWYFRVDGAVLIVALLAGLTLLEFYKLLAAMGEAPFPLLGAGFGVLLTIDPWLEWKLGRPLEPVLGLAVVLFSVRILGERPAEKRVSALASTLFGLVYVGCTLQYLIRLMTPEAGDVVAADGRLVLGLWVVAAAKFSDVGGLLAGMAFGRHALAPGISPKKTWEGAAGGVLMSMLVGVLVAWLGRSVLPVGFTLGRAALAAIPVAAIAIVSDLVESVIKRRADLKDSGAVIPGIGGMFDLTDSILFAAPVGYFLLRPYLL